MFKFIKDKNYKLIKQKFNDIGIHLDKKSYANLKDDVWREILYVLKDLLQIYSFIPFGFISEINTNEYRNIASVGFISSDCELTYNIYNGLQIRLNKFYFSNKNNFSKKISDSNFAWRKNENNIILTEDDYIKVGISHEFGHIIDIYKTIFHLKLYSKKLSEKDVISFLKHIEYLNNIIPKEIYNLYPKKRS